MSRGGAPGGGAVVLDVAQLEALLTRTFSIGLDVGRGREKVALVRLRLSRALLGAAETQAMAAGALAIERGVAAEQIAAAEGLALHAAAFIVTSSRPGSAAGSAGAVRCRSQSAVRTRRACAFCRPSRWRFRSSSSSTTSDGTTRRTTSAFSDGSRRCQSKLVKNTPSISAEVSRTTSRL